MSSRTRSRKQASIGSNHSLRRPTPISASEPRTGNFVLLLVMAWSPPAHNAGNVRVSAPGDYATFNSNHTPDGTRGHERAGERKSPLGCASPVKRITLERKARQCNGTRHLCAVGIEREGIIQARHICGRREVEIQCPSNHAPLAVFAPRAKLASEEECSPPLKRIDGGQSAVAM